MLVAVYRQGGQLASQHMLEWLTSSYIITQKFIATLIKGSEMKSAFALTTESGSTKLTRAGI